MQDNEGVNVPPILPVNGNAPDNSLPQKNNPKPKVHKIIAIVSVLVFVIAVLSFAAIYLFSQRSQNPVKEEKGQEVLDTFSLSKFASEEEFKSYFAENTSTPGFGSIMRFDVGQDNISLSPEMSEVQRTSETNIQVQGVDEPDILKVQDDKLFFSSSSSYVEPFPVFDVLREEDLSQPRIKSQSTKILNAYPVEALAIESESIERSGEMLLSGNNLILIGNEALYGYDVSDKEAPKDLWQMEIGQDTRVVTARLFEGEVYLITATSPQKENPCPISPMRLTQQEVIAVECTDILRPDISVPVDTVFTALKIDPATGGVIQKTSFVGASYSTVIYMSQQNLYITHSYNKDYAEFMLGYYSSVGGDFLPQSYIEKIKKLSEYDISQISKITEIQLLIEEYMATLSDDERLKIENDSKNKLADYFKQNIRDYQKTGINRISVADLSVQGSAVVPGVPLNQFSLDEHDGYLRVATSLGSGFGFSVGETENDVYVVNQGMQITGSALGLGIDERIYSARFVGNRGYIVTFKQIDPFYVLDLSDPANPKVTGELKIPGFSSYLHPINESRILGIGEEDRKVKLSLFDISDPHNPQEISKYNMDENWSEVSTNHHAFLLDNKHQVFFIPASQGAYIFSYEGDKLTLTRAVSDVRTRRAAFINDLFYVVADDKIVVLDENTWEQKGELSFL